MKLAVFLTTVFFGEVSPENFRESVSEKPTKFDFFSQPIRRPVVWHDPPNLIV